MNEKIQYLVDNLRETNKEIRFRDSTEDVMKIKNLLQIKQLMLLMN